MTPTARTMKAIRLRLPYPPSVNRYWRHVTIKGSVRVLISKEGRTYQSDVYAAVAAAGVEPFSPIARLEVVIQLWPPDRVRRDVDNTQKALLDAIQHAGIYGDDSQIDALCVYRRGLYEGGRVDVEISEIEQSQAELFS